MRRRLSRRILPSIRGHAGRISDLGQKGRYRESDAENTTNPKAGEKTRMRTSIDDLPESVGQPRVKREHIGNEAIFSPWVSLVPGIVCFNAVSTHLLRCRYPRGDRNDV
jgi:hypothetical protein